VSPELASQLIIIGVGSLVAASCALVGTFLVLRRIVLLGDAISHSVLLGIVLAFLASGSQAPIPMVLGAGAIGVLTVFLVEVLNHSRRLYEDASIGVVFPALFSIGVILVSRYAAQVHLDIECVLYGEIAFAPQDRLLVGGTDIGPKALWVTGAVFLADLLLVLLLYKELKLASFDPDLAGSTGFSPVLIHYLLMLAVSVTVVASFESVGAILVVAMLVVPPATAYLLTDRLSLMLFLAAVIGIAATLGGYQFSRHYDCSVAGSMAACAGVIFTLVFLLSPSHGVLRRSLLTRRLRLRLESRILLLHLRGPGEWRKASEIEGSFQWSRARWQRVVKHLVREGLVELAGDDLRITEDGSRALAETGAAFLAHRN
jgi:manganese/zinc/iron transport system permease protein